MRSNPGTVGVCPLRPRRVYPAGAGVLAKDRKGRKTSAWLCARFRPTGASRASTCSSFFSTLTSRSELPLRRDKPAGGDPRAAFTLAELLLVITIIAILLGLLYSAIKTAGRYSRETITRGELVNIEAAWKQYFAYYHTWPTNEVEEGTSNARDTDNQIRYKVLTDSDDGTGRGGDVQYEIGPRLARMLEGVPTTNTTITPNVVLNPDAVPFLELTRFEKGTGAPISAWGDLRGKRYFVKLDINCDNTLSVPTNSSGVAIAVTNIFRRVAVWTVHPEKPGEIIGSWQR
jgi:prepilin-type N-terminal cleavage/methylation domain-containing protein